MRPDLFDKKLNQDTGNREELENPLAGPVMLIR